MLLIVLGHSRCSLNIQFSVYKTVSKGLSTAFVMSTLTLMAVPSYQKTIIFSEAWSSYEQLAYLKVRLICWIRKTSRHSALSNEQLMSVDPALFRAEVIN